MPAPGLYYTGSKLDLQYYGYRTLFWISTTSKLTMKDSSSSTRPPGPAGTEYERTYECSLRPTVDPQKLKTLPCSDGHIIQILQRASSTFPLSFTPLYLQPAPRTPHA